MKGLIIKDLANILTQKRIIIILAVLIFAGIFIPDMNESFSLGVLSMLSLLLILTLFSLDEQSNWNKFALTIGVSRNDLVISKYLMAIILMSITFIITLILGLVEGSLSLPDILLTSSLLFSSTMIIIALLIPPIIRFGVQKSKLIILIPVFLFVLLGQYVPYISNFLNYINYLPVVAIILFILSALLSIQFMARKEFQ